MPELLYLYLHAGPSAECMPERIPQGEGSGREARTRLAEIPLTRFGVLRDVSRCTHADLISRRPGEIDRAPTPDSELRVFRREYAPQVHPIKRLRWTLVPPGAG